MIFAVMENEKMDDYISRQMAMDSAHKKIFSKWELFHEKSLNEQDIKDMLCDLPSADVQLVRHGHWIANNYFSMKCDQCGYSIPDWRWVESKYCPNCGARMDGE